MGYFNCSLDIGEINLGIIINTMYGVLDIIEWFGSLSFEYDSVSALYFSIFIMSYKLIELVDIHLWLDLIRR